jgi:hypothetical protein
MLAQFLVKILDPVYAPRDAKLVRCFWSPQFDAGYSRNEFVPMERLDKGVYRFGPIQWTAEGTFYFWIEEEGYETVFDYLVHRQNTPLGAWEFGHQKPEFYVRNRSVTSRDGDGINLEVFAVLSRLSDARDEIKAVQLTGQQKGLNLVPDPISVEVRQFESTILNPAGTGEDRLRMSRRTLTPKGKMYYLKSEGYPKLIGVYDPRAANRQADQAKKTPINYHLFFHPGTFHYGNVNYPWDYKYPDTIARYLFIEPRPYIGKAMAAQHEAGDNESVLVFPVGSATKWFQGLNSQSSVLRLIQEINYFIQRKAGVGIPLQPVGQLALSSFSASIAFVAQIVAESRGVLMARNILREVYCFDGFFPKEAAASEAAFFANATGWLRGDLNTRALRVYTQNSTWWNAFNQAVPGTPVATGPSGSSEAESASHSVFFAPTPFWSWYPMVLPAEGLYDNIHQLIPCWFLQHAMKLSRMR